MKNVHLNFFLLLLAFAGLGFQSCERDAASSLTEAERLEAEFIQAFETYQTLPIPPRPNYDLATIEALEQKARQQDETYRQIVQREVERIEASGEGDQMSFRAFKAAAKAEVYTQDVIDFRNMLQERTAPRKAALRELSLLKDRLAAYRPELNDLGAYETFLRLTGHTVHQN